MRIHILGICGTFMGGIALIARALGHEVTGSDSNIYPPMSTLLDKQGINVKNGYRVEHLQPVPDIVIVGNTMSRGNDVVEYMLNTKMPFTSGPQWLSEHVLKQHHVLAVSGTHGKTTTTSMLAWILEYAGLSPGFLIGGVAENFNTSARTGQGDYFVVEADEYDTAFFDKRSKFIHYCPDTLVINNLEFDHADIFPDLESIKMQFRYLLRIVPGNGRVIYHEGNDNITDLLSGGFWSESQTFSAVAGDWCVGKHTPDYSGFSVVHDKIDAGTVKWSLIGEHNAENALAAIAAAAHVGVSAQVSIAALEKFRNVKRRLERLGEVNGIIVYDDFAHHPTAIHTTLVALRNKVGKQRIHIVLEPRSNTMKAGVHSRTLGPALDPADFCYIFQSAEVKWNIADSISANGNRRRVFTSTDDIITALMQNCEPGDHIVIMSNGGFESIHQRLLQRLKGV